MFIICAVCTWTIKSHAFPKGDLQLTQCSHFGREAFPLDDDVDVVVLVIMALPDVLVEEEPNSSVVFCGCGLHSVHEASISSFNVSHLHVNLSLQ